MKTSATIMNARVAQSPKTIMAIPFDLDKYQTGQYSLETRNGMKVEHLTTTGQICGTIENASGDLMLQTYTRSGFVKEDDSPSALDLFMYQKKETLNEYRKNHA